MGCNLNLLNFHHTSSAFFIISLFHLTPALEDVLDVWYPIIITDSEQHNSSKISKTYFGYTVSLAEGISGDRKRSSDPDGWIFIGAPKSNAPPSMYDSNTTPVEPGVIWRCSLGRGSGVADSCTRVNIDPSPDSGARPAKTTPRRESHDGAWVGVAMEVNYDRLLTCGMRWNRGDKTFYNGLCYWFADTKSSDKSCYLSSDLSKLVDQSTYEQRLTPFFRMDRDADRLFNFTNSKNEPAEGHEWQTSLAGMSVHLFKDKGLDGDGTSMPNLLIGAPGVREYSGAVVLYTNEKSPPSDLSRPNRNRIDRTFSTFVVGNRGMIPNTGMATPEQNYWNEYFGYSVSSGRYFNKEKILYVAGAPRAELSGKAIIFDFPPYQKPKSTYKRQIESIFEITPPKISFGSYFGSVLHSIDSDQDGLDELIVGAPLYNIEGTEEDSGDHGCVFVYRFENKEDNKTIRSVQELSGPKKSRARFGSAISSLVFKLKNPKRTQIYLVIGAPYEDKDTGAVYLYPYNAATEKFGPKFSQRIAASSISESLNGFGCSLSIPKDIDYNQTPEWTRFLMPFLDIAIGSYKSGHAVVLRTRTKISLVSWIKFLSHDERKEITEIPLEAPKFILTSCYKITESLGLVVVTPGLDIYAKVSLNDPTIQFDTSDVQARLINTPKEIIYLQKFSPSNKDRCMDLNVVAVNNKNGIGMDDSDPNTLTETKVKHPLHFVQEVWYNETANRPLSVLNYYANNSDNSPKGQQREPPQEVEFQSFDERKPSPQTSISRNDLHISMNTCDDEVCKPDVSISLSFFNEKNESLSFFTVGSAKEVRLQIVIENSGETTPEPSLTLDWSITDITESSSGFRWLQTECEDHSNSVTKTYGCKLGRRFQKEQIMKFDINFVMDNIFVSEPTDFQFAVDAVVRFSDSHIKETTKKVGIQLLVPDTIVTVMGSRENDTLRTPLRYIASVDGQSGQDGKKQRISLYSLVRHRYTIEVRGASVKKLTAEFKIHVMQNNADSRKGAQLILVRKPLSRTSGVTCRPSPSGRFAFHIIDSMPDGSSAVSISGSHSSDNSNQFISDSDSKADPIYRRRRDTPENNVPTASVPPLNEGVQIAIDTKQISPPSKPGKVAAGKDAVKLSCDNSEANCLEVTCILENVKANTHNHISFELYLNQDQTDKLLATNQKSSIFIESTGFAHIFNFGSHHHEDSDVAQTDVHKISAKGVEPWWYVVAGMSGILLLALIIGGLYKVGFFKREKRQQLNQMRAEHHRKSMMTAARMSMLQATSVDDGLSFEDLTETEHHNEDREQGEDDKQGVK